MSSLLTIFKLRHVQTRDGHREHFYSELIVRISFPPNIQSFAIPNSYTEDHYSVMLTESRHSAMYRGHFHFPCVSLPLNQLTCMNRRASGQTPKGGSVAKHCRNGKTYPGIRRLGISVCFVHLASAFLPSAKSWSWHHRMWIRMHERMKKDVQIMELSSYYAMLVQPSTEKANTNPA